MTDTTGLRRGEIAADIVIAGGGIAGLALGLALKQARGSGLVVQLHDPAFSRSEGGEARAYAISAGGRRMLETLGVWAEVAASAQPLTAMDITDSRLDEPVRPLFLSFEGDVRPGEPFAHMLEGAALLNALKTAAAEIGLLLSDIPITDFRIRGEWTVVSCADGGETRARLLVAADGGRSKLREKAGIAFYGWSYDQSAIVGVITHARDHGGRAVEHFLPSGPFALLPLPPDGTGRHRSSIVWTERTADAARIIGRDRETVGHMIETRFGLGLGDIALAGSLKAYPLSLGLARSFVAERLALLGDAAHVIHPIAGQGLNLGLKDAAALAEAIVDQLRLGLDPGAPEVLEVYQRARRFDTARMAVTTDILNRLFSNDIAPLRQLRDLGLGLVDRLPGLKDMFIGQAAGSDPTMPRMMRGEAL